MEGVDVISQLPEDIIHHILSYPSTKEACKLSLCCKAWHSAWLTCPTLDFAGDIQLDFVKIISGILGRYKKPKLIIEQLRLPFIMYNITDDQLNESVGIAAQNGLRRLQLYCPRLYNPLPPAIFEAKTIQELIVCGRRNVILRKQVRGASPGMSKHLQRLDFLEVYLEDVTFQNIISSCPSLECLRVLDCRGSQIIKVKHSNLKEFTVSGGGHHHVEIEAPTLQCLDCDLALLGRTLKLYNTENVKYLSLVDTLPATISLDNFMHEFPRVEELRLSFCDGIGKISLSSPSLKRIQISINEVKLLSKVKIDAPRMVSLEYTNHKHSYFFPKLSVINPPSHEWVSKISLRDIRHMGTDELFKLNEFLAAFVNSKISLALSFHSDCEFEDFTQINIPTCRFVQAEDLQLRFGFVEALRFTKFSLDDYLLKACHDLSAMMLRRYDEAMDRGYLQPSDGRKRLKVT